MTLLPTSEVFGPTWQGEGPYTGTRVGFVRLGLCNLSCSWCDTPYTWDTTRFNVAEECPPTPVESIHARLEAMAVSTVVLSGGEPLIHARSLPELLTPAWFWQVETNGTIAPPAWWSQRVHHSSVSPKVNTGDPEKKRLKLAALGAWNELAQDGAAIFKFVAGQSSDLAEVARVADLVGIEAHHVWVMPEGTTPEQVITTHQDLADDILARGWNTTTRLHTLLYGQERGR